MRLGIFGGTFDPVHDGHLVLAEQCREQCRLDEVWFVPAGSPPHKSAIGITSGNHRAEMLELAIAGHEAFRVNRLELARQGPSYTVETLQQLHAEESSRELFFLIGADSLVDLPMWREPRQIADLATLVVVNRGGLPTPDLAPLVPVLGEAAIARVQVVSIPALDISSRDLRRRVRKGRSVRYLTPRAVECYIATHGLYREGPVDGI